MDIKKLDQEPLEFLSLHKDKISHLTPTGKLSLILYVLDIGFEPAVQNQVLDRILQIFDLVPSTVLDELILRGFDDLALKVACEYSVTKRTLLELMYMVLERVDLISNQKIRNILPKLREEDLTLLLEEKSRIYLVFLDEVREFILNLIKQQKEDIYYNNKLRDLGE